MEIREENSGEKTVKMEINGLIVTFTVADHVYCGDRIMRASEVIADYVEAILLMSESLKSRGIKRIEVASIGYFAQNKKTSGRFFPLSTMHVARLLKR